MTVTYLIQSQKNTLKHRRTIRNYIQSGHVNIETLPLIQAILKQITSCVGSGPIPQFKLRQVYHLIHHKLIQVLSNTNPYLSGIDGFCSCGDHVSPVQESIIEDLLSCFD